MNAGVGRAVEKWRMEGLRREVWSGVESRRLECGVSRVESKEEWKVEGRERETERERDRE